jgi:hypothetical protein
MYGREQDLSTVRDTVAAAAARSAHRAAVAVAMVAFNIAAVVTISSALRPLSSPHLLTAQPPPAATTALPLNNAK